MRYQIGDRIRSYREKINMSQKDFAEKVGISPNRASNWERGINRPDADMLSIICRVLNVSPDVLLGLPSKRASEITAQEQSHIQKYRSLDPHGREVVDSVLSMEYNRIQELERQQEEYDLEFDESSEVTIKQMPLYALPVSAGTGEFLDSDYYELIDVPMIPETKDANFAVKVSGDSMEPKYYDGDIVLVKQQPCIEIGEIGIFIVNGEGYIKELGEKILVSKNPNYDDIKLTEYDEVSCKGKVLGTID